MLTVFPLPLSKYEVRSKCIETEAVFTIDRNEQYLINFLQNSPCGFQHIYSSEFAISRSTSKTHLLIWCESVPSYFFQYASRPQFFFFLRMNFLLRNQNKVI